MALKTFKLNQRHDPALIKWLDKCTKIDGRSRTNAIDLAIKQYCLSIDPDSKLKPKQRKKNA